MAPIRRIDRLHAASPTGEIPPDEIFDVLSNERRQCALHYLLQRGDDAVPLRDLVDYVAAWENDAETGSISGDARKRVYTALRQSHLPRMEEAGLIEFRHNRGEISLTDQAEEVRMYLEYVPGNEIPWSMYYLALSAVAAALVAVHWAGFYPFDTISGTVLAGAVVVAFAGSAIVHVYQMERYRIGADRFTVDDR